MARTLLTTARRNRATLIEDALGASALIITLMMALHLPMLF